MKKQYLPIIVRRSGEHQYAKPFSSYSTRIGDKFFWDLEQAKDAIEQAKRKFNTKKPHTMVCGGFGITSEHSESNEIVDSYIKVREVTEWEVINN